MAATTASQTHAAGIALPARTRVYGHSAVQALRLEDYAAVISLHFCVAHQEAEHGKRGLTGLDETMQQTYISIDEIAEEVHGNRHPALRIPRSFLYLICHDRSIDESARLPSQLPLLIERSTTRAGISHATCNSSGSRMGSRFIAETSIRRVFERHVSSGKMRQVGQSLPAHVRELLEPAVAEGRD